MLKKSYEYFLIFFKHFTSTFFLFIYFHLSKNTFLSKSLLDFAGFPDFRLNEPVDPNLCTKKFPHKFSFTGTFWWKHPIRGKYMSFQLPKQKNYEAGLKKLYGWVSCEVVGCIVSITPFLEYCTAC